MNERMIISTGRSIKTRALLLLLGLTVISVLSIAIVSVNALFQAGQNAQEAAEKIVIPQAEQFLVQLTISTAEQNNTALDDVAKDAAMVARYAASVFEQPAAFNQSAFWTGSDHLYMGAEGQYFNSEEDLSSVWIPNTTSVDEALLNKLEVAAYLDLVFKPVYQHNPNTVAIYIIGRQQQQEFTRLYPNINLGEILPPDFAATEDIFFTSGTPEENPERAVVWTPIYEDPAQQGLLVTAVAPIYLHEDEFLGIIGIDVSLAELTQTIEEAAPVNQGYSLLVNENGQAIALPEQGYLDILGRSRGTGEFGPYLTESAVFAPILGQMMAGETGFQSFEQNERELFVAYAPLEGTGWSLANVVEGAALTQVVATLQQELGTTTRSLILNGVLPVGGLLLLVVMVVGVWLTNRLVEPIQKLAEAAQIIGTGQWETPLPETSYHELSLLSQALKSMAQQIQALVVDLEQRVAERTDELAQANTRLQELDRLKTRFVGDVSHELRTPISNLKLSLDLLERGKPEKRQKYMTVLNEQVERLEQLVARILDLSQLEIAVSETVLGPVDLNDIIRQVVARLEVEITAKGLD